MPLATLTVTLPAGTWVSDVSTSYPSATIRVLAGMPDEGVGVALVEVTAPDLEPVLRAMVAHDGLTDVEPLHRTDDRMVLQIETPTPLLLTTLQAAGIPVQPPVTISEGVADLELRTSHDRLSTLGDQLDRFGLEYTVEAIREGPDPDSLLSDHQAAILETALSCGYYDTPRTCSLTELADRLDIAKSTCSETLHRAESHVIRRFVETHLAADHDTSSTAGTPTGRSHDGDAGEGSERPAPGEGPADDATDAATRPYPPS